MRVEIKPGRAAGVITAPPSKSVAHRLLICAALSDGVSRISGISDCEDVSATLESLKALGVNAVREGDDIIITGKNMLNAVPRGTLWCGESGSTLRFLIPIAMLSGKTAMFSGKGRLMERPMEIYEKLSRERGLLFVKDGESITVKGPLRGGEFAVAGNISSQFISGLIFALPLLKKDSIIKIAPPIESRSYIDLTLDAVRQFGILARWVDDYTISIKGGQSYKAQNLSVEGDFSGAAFPEALNLFGGEVTVNGLREDSIQGDRVFRKYFELLKGGVPTVHIGDCPDLGPILFAISAAKCGGVFTGTKRLKIKESDRARAMAEELKKFGTSVTVLDDKVVVYPAAFKKPCEVLSGHNDHRIVMALAVLLSITGGEIEGAEAVKKSYPSFFEDLRTLGIEVTEYDA